MSYLSNPRRDSSRISGAISFEVSAWIVVTGIALSLRLVGLGLAPLSTSEAREALAALEASRSGVPTSGYTSPLLLSLNAMSFTLFGASDSLSRLWPALAGAALVLTPVLLREWIGRFGALAAGLYLAISPSMVYASRQVNGAALSYLGVMVTIGASASLLRSSGRGWIWLAVGGGALALSSSPQIYTVLAGWTLSCGMLFVLDRACARAQIERIVDEPLPNASVLVASLLVGVLILSTGLGWNPSGLSASGQMLIEWGRQFASGETGSVSPVILLTVYEILALWLGTAAAVSSFRRKDFFGQFLVCWTVASMLLQVLAPSGRPLHVAALLLPLSLLAGKSVDRFTALAGGRGKPSGVEVTFTLLVLVLWCHIHLALIHYQGPAGTEVDLLLAVLAVALQVLAAMLFALAQGAKRARECVAVGTGIMLLVATVSFTRRLAFDVQARTMELLVDRPVVSTDVRELVQTIDDIAWLNNKGGGVPGGVQLDARSSANPVLVWYLRELVEVPSSEDPQPAQFLIVASQEDDIPAAVPGTTYVGSSFRVTETWNPASILPQAAWFPDLRDVVAWLLLRRPVTSVSAPLDGVILWIPQ